MDAESMYHGTVNVGNTFINGTFGMIEMNELMYHAEAKLTAANDSRSTDTSIIQNESVLKAKDCKSCNYD